MSIQGYYRFPTICKDNVVFVSEDDLWSVEVKGGVARRLTANLGTITFPALSPDGERIAFTGREEGNAEVYVMDAAGGPVKRVTYVGGMSQVVGWTLDGEKIVFASNYGKPMGQYLFAVSPAGGLPEELPFGMAVYASFGPKGKVVIGRNNSDPARWKRYRGGTAGELWVDNTGTGEFRKLIELKGNLARPIWVGDRIYFVSDHEGVGNLYSVTPGGDDLKRHTEHADYYVRFPASDGRKIVYHAGADLYVFNPEKDKVKKIEVKYHSPRVHRQRKFVDPSKYLESYNLHPKGSSLALNIRGKSFTMGNWEGPVLQQNADANEPLRTRLTTYLHDGKRLATVTDVDGVDVLEVHDLSAKTVDRIEGLDLGRVRRVVAAPRTDELLLSNHRNELLLADLKDRTLKLIDKSPADNIADAAWSPDGNWAAYSYAPNSYVSCIKLWKRETGETFEVTEPILHDTNPVWDPDGKYLYFLGQREFNPVYDALHFDLGFPKGTRPYLITLKSDLPSPFIPAVKAEEESKPDEKSKEEEEAKKEEKKEEPKPVEIDLDGISKRVLAFPVPEGRYAELGAIKGKAIWSVFPVEGALESNWVPGSSEPKGSLQAYDFKELETIDLLGGISSFKISMDGKTMACRVNGKLRVLPAGNKVADDPKATPRKAGWIDLSRVKVCIEPTQEWRQMAREVWRLQAEYFWTPDMSKVDWQKVWDRYYPLIERTGTRAEFSDLMWEMQGELGTSHCYEMGGDYRPEPSYPMGFLGADLAYDETSGAYRVVRIVDGTPGEAKAFSPLSQPGVNVKAGDLIKAVNGREVSRQTSPQSLLVNLAGAEVTLTVSRDGNDRDVTLTTLASEAPLRYRDWVEANRRYVHQKSGGKVGYVHIPDMGARGYAEFHRLYLAEVAYDAMIVDVRFNGGGHVSELIIEKLARRRVGYDLARWGQPAPYPSSSVAGPMVCLTNQFAGSDGDIFSHVWKLKKLGTLIGKRTWGGVIGIWPRNALADGSFTSQPEFSFWFMDVGWGVENYGTDPDIEVDIAPQDYAAGRDPQLDKALEVVMRQLEENPPLKPDFGGKPDLSLPTKLG